MRTIFIHIYTFSGIILIPWGVGKIIFLIDHKINPSSYFIDGLEWFIGFAFILVTISISLLIEAIRYSYSKTNGENN